MKIMIGFLRVALSAVCIVLLAFNLLFLASSYLLGDETPGIAGYRILPVKTMQMAPALATGDAVLIDRADSYDMGDVIVTRQAGKTDLIRIVGTTGRRFIGKADDANAQETLLDSKSIIGRVVLSVAGFGIPLAFLQTPVASAVLFLMLILILLLPALGKQREPQTRAEAGQNSSAMTGRQSRGGKRYAKRSSE